MKKLLFIQIFLKLFKDQLFTTYYPKLYEITKGKTLSLYFEQSGRNDEEYEEIGASV